MADHFRMAPAQRIQKLKEFNRRLANTPESMEVLKQFNFGLDNQLVQFDGRKLKLEQINFGVDGGGNRYGLKKNPIT